MPFPIQKRANPNSGLGPLSTGQTRIERPRLGIEAYGVELTPNLSAEFGALRAVRVVRVGPDGPAHKGGIRGDDLVLAANGSPVSDIDDIQRAMVFAEGAPINLDVVRDHARRSHVVSPDRHAA